MKKKILIIADSSTYHIKPRGIQANRLINEMSKFYSVFLITSNISVPDDNVYFSNKIKKIIIVRTQSNYIRILTGKIWRYFRGKDIFWYLKARKSALSIIKKEKITILITFSMIHSNSDVGKYCKAKIKDIKWFSFLSDPLSLNPYLSRYKIQNLILKKYEKKIFHDSDKIIFPSYTMKKIYSEIYSDISNKIHVIPHSFEKKNKLLIKKPNNIFYIKHFGLLNEERSPLPLIEFILTEKNWFKSQNIKFEFIGKINKKLKNKIDSIENQFIIFKEEIEYNLISDIIAKANLLLIIDANFSTSPFLPSKLVEYLPYHIPILGITPKGSETERVLNETNNYVVNISTIHLIKNIVNKLIDEGHSISQQTAHKIEQYKISNIINQWKDLITN